MFYVWLTVCFNTIKLFFVALILAIVDSGNRILNTVNGIKLPLLQLYILYFNLVLFFLAYAQF